MASRREQRDATGSRRSVLSLELGVATQSSAGDRLTSPELVRSTSLNCRSSETLTVEFSTRCVQLCGQRALRRG